jgi:hypothetical protein
MPLNISRYFKLNFAKLSKIFKNGRYWKFIGGLLRGGEQGFEAESSLYRVEICFKK